jgi:hypothetical protein
MLACWLAVSLLFLHNEPLEWKGGHTRDHATLILGLSVQTSGRVFQLCLAGSESSSQHAISAPVQLCSSSRPLAAVPLQRECNSQQQKGAPAASSHPRDGVSA